MKKEFILRAIITIGLLCLVLVYTPAENAAQSLSSRLITALSSIRPGLDRSFAGKEDFQHSRPVADGIIHNIEWQSKGPLFINSLSIDLSKKHISIEAEKGGDRLFTGEKVAAIAGRESGPGRTVIAAVNGDFWMTGFRPVGLFVDDDTILNMPNPQRSVFFMDDRGAPHIGILTMDLSLTDGKMSVPIAEINLPGDAESILMTPRYGNEITFKEPRTIFMFKQEGRRFIPNERCRVKFVDQAEGMTQILCPDPGTFILAVVPSKAKEFESLVKKTRRLFLMPKVGEFDRPIVLTTGGVPRLVRDGKISVEYETEKIGESFSTTLHPRTALGISKDRKTLFLVTVDGRQPGLSAGHSLDDLAELMKKMGAWDAVNLDGGGSTTMWVRGEVVNRPSDATGPRTVSTSLLVISSAPQGKPTRLEISPQDARIPAGAAVRITVSAFDANHTPLEIDDSQLEWAIPSTLGVKEAGGMVRFSDKPVEGKISVGLRGLRNKAEANFKVMKTDSLEIRPTRVIMRSGQTRRLQVRALGPGGEPLLTLPEMIRASVPRGLTWSRESLELTGTERGRYEMTIGIGPVRQALTVFVDHFTTSVIQSFDDIALVGMTGQNTDETQTVIQTETENIREGAAALMLKYNLKQGGTSAVYLNINSSISGEPHAIGVWVYGDGREHWLRGVIEDADGEKFIADFTDGTKGIYWKDEWRFVETEISGLTAHWGNPRATLDHPLKVNQLYLVQTREDKKSAGSIVLDALSAIYPAE